MEYLRAQRGNGFPRVESYKLQVIGKDSRCPQSDTQGESRSSNVVYTPSSGAGLILIQSGVGVNPDFTALQVTDACSEFDGNPAAI